VGGANMDMTNEINKLIIHPGDDQYDFQRAALHLVGAMKLDPMFPLRNRALQQALSML